MQHLYLRRHEGAVCLRARAVRHRDIGGAVAASRGNGGHVRGRQSQRCRQRQPAATRSARPIAQAVPTASPASVTCNGGLSGTITLSSGEIAIFDALTLSSPLLNAGDPSGSGLPGKDQRGLVRIAASRVDIGAIERQSPENVIFRNGLQ